MSSKPLFMSFFKQDEAVRNVITEINDHYTAMNELIGYATYVTALLKLNLLVSSRDKLRSLTKYVVSAVSSSYSVLTQLLKRKD